MLSLLPICVCALDYLRFSGVISQTLTSFSTTFMASKSEIKANSISCLSPCAYSEKYTDGVNSLTASTHRLIRGAHTFIHSAITGNVSVSLC